MEFDAVPASVRRNVIGWNGSAGERWLDSLPPAVERLLGEWRLRRVGRPLEGGTHSYVLPVERPEGSPAVLKVIYVDEENQGEPAALRAYDGDGAVRLYEFDPATGAMLLERALPGTSLLEANFDGAGEHEAARRRFAIACGLYRRLWRAPETNEGLPPLPTSDDMTAGWEALFADPEPELVDKLGADRIKQGLELSREVTGPAEVGIGNRDTHLGNIVSAEREPWLLIDPKPYLAERAFDAGYFLFKQELHGPLGGTELLRLVAGELGVDIERVRAWALLRSIDQAAAAGDEGELADCVRVIEAIERA